MKTPILLTFFLAVVPACDPGPDVGSDTLAQVSDNTLSDNRLSYNRLSYNRLSYNRLSYNRLSYNRLSYNSLDNDMHADADGREILRYITRCALVEGDILVVDSEAGTFEFPGLMGLAPNWEDEAIGEAQQETITACLLAHVNKFGVSVPISVRGKGLDCTADELSRFTRYEGAFFGNIFDPEGAMYACRNGSSPDGYDASLGDRMLRVCGDSDCNAFLALGASCSELCVTDADGSYVDCATKAKRSSNTKVYAGPMQVWLLDAEDSAAVWPNHTDMLKAYHGSAKLQAPKVSPGQASKSL